MTMPRFPTLLLAAALAAGAPTLLRADTASEQEEKFQKACDAAIDRGLARLAQNQQPDGSWAGAGPEYAAAYTALPVMAYLARGYTPNLPPYGDRINRGIDCLLRRQQANGLFSANMYAHCIATLTLAEVSGMVDAERQARLDAALPKALKVILDAQRVPKGNGHQGGWRYSHQSNDSDISLSGWALMSLRAARANGAGVPAEAIDQAVQFILRLRNADGGFSYMPGQSNSNLARTGVGLLCLELTGRHRDDLTRKAGDYILANFTGSVQNEIFYYSVYYCAQGMFQLGGEEWDKFAPMLYDLLLKSQQPDGSWPVRGQHETAYGPNYSTAMAILALSVTCRQLPIYQR
ncbi:MAG: prenyltransferase/squalene oxidase repeat-containing protein [Lentisphaeria bacterium]|jgi:hypothetical protein